MLWLAEGYLSKGAETWEYLEGVTAHFASVQDWPPGGNYRNVVDVSEEKVQSRHLDLGIAS